MASAVFSFWRKKRTHRDSSNELKLNWVRIPLRSESNFNQISVESIQLHCDDHTQQSSVLLALHVKQPQDPEHHPRQQLKHCQVHHQKNAATSSPVLRHSLIRYMAEANYVEQEEARDESEEDQTRDRLHSESALQSLVNALQLERVLCSS